MGHLDDLKYFRTNGGTKDKINTPTPAALKNNIKAAMGLCSYLLNKADFDKINLRLITQDALENLFGLIKNLQGCNHKLTAEHFMNAFKTTLLTTFAKFRVEGSNCEKEDIPAIIELDDLFGAIISEDFKNNCVNYHSEEPVEDLDYIDTPQIHLEDNNENWDFIFNNLMGEDIENDGNNSASDLETSDSVFDSMTKFLKKYRCLSCKFCIFRENEIGIPAISETLRRNISDGIKIFNETYANKLHEPKIVGTITGFMETWFSDDWNQCKVHLAKSLNREIIKKLVNRLIRRETEKIKRNIKLEETRAANAGKIAELSGKAKWYVKRKKFFNSVIGYRIIETFFNIFLKYRIITSG